MRVGFDVSQTCVARAGCAWHADSLARALASHLGACNLILYHHFGNWINYDTRDGTTIPGCDSPLRAYNYESAKELWKKIEAGAEAVPSNPSVVHSNSFMAPLLGETPLVYTIHDLSFFTHPQYTTEANQRFCASEFRKALNFSCAFHFISHATLEDFNQLYPKYLEDSRKPFRVIHSAPRLGSNTIREAVNEPSTPWLFIGTIEPRKNIEGLLDAFEYYLKVSANPRPLVIAGGKGWLSDSFHQRFEYLTKQGMFEYLGQISDDRLSKLYRESFAFLFPSHCEGFGLPVIEAMNHSLPVISNKIKSIQEFAEDVATFVHFEDTEDVVSQMIALESDANHYQEQACKSKITAEKFDWSKTAAQLIPLYEAAIASKDCKRTKNVEDLSS